MTCSPVPLRSREPEAKDQSESHFVYLISETICLAQECYLSNVLHMYVLKSSVWPEERSSLWKLNLNVLGNFYSR